MLRDVPNVLTVLRLVAVPAIVALLIADEGAEGPLRWAALAVFVLAGVTDWLDGFLARRWGVVSSFGKLADPLADKALVLAALVMLAAMNEVPWWPLIVVAVREIGVTLGRLAVARDVVIPASAGGKLKTALQMLALLLLLVPGVGGWLDVVGFWVLVASVVVAVLTGIDYAWRIARTARAHGQSPAASAAVTPQAVRGTADAG